MDWEIYDLDADEIVIRRPSFSRQWGDAHSSKPMPRAAGSINRARRCEHVQELKRFCGDNKNAVPGAGQPTLRQHVSCDGHTRKLREAASRSSLRGEWGRKHSRPRLRLRTVLSCERGPDGRRRFQALKSPRNLSSTSLHRPNSPRQSPLSAGADRVNSVGRKDLDCECYYPGVTVLPSVRNSLEGAEEGGSEQHSTEGKKDSQTEQKVDFKSLPTVPLFVNPWNGRRATDDASSSAMGSIGKSAVSCHGPSPSNESAARASDSFEYDSPSTPATSAFSSIASPAQSLRDKPVLSRDSKQIETRCFPNRGSSGRAQEITGSNLRAHLSPHSSQEHLALRVRVLDASPSMTSAEIQSKRNGRHWPLSSVSFESDEIRPGSSTYSSDNLFFEFPIRDRLASAPSIPVMREEPRELHANYISNVADSVSSTRSRSLGDLLSAMPDPEPENQPAQAASSDRCSTICQSSTIKRAERCFPIHRRGVAVSRAIHPASNTQSPKAPRKAGSQSQLGTRAPAPITIPEHTPKALFASIPRSPRTDRPSSPPKIPLPADPPVPPSRGSSYKSAATHAGNESSESLVDPALFERSNLGSSFTQDHKATSQARGTLRRNWSEYALCNREEVQKTSNSAPLSLASSARVSRIEYSQNSATESSEVNGNPTQDWHDTRVAPSSPSYTFPVYKNEFNPPRPSPLSRQPSHTFSPSQPPSPEQLESRLVFLERQNKMLQAALIAALDFGAAAGHGTDSPRSGSGKILRSTAPTPVPGWGSGSQSVVSEEKDNNPVSTRP